MSREAEVYENLLGWFSDPEHFTPDTYQRTDDDESVLQTCALGGLEHVVFQMTGSRQSRGGYYAQDRRTLYGRCFRNLDAIARQAYPRLAKSEDDPEYGENPSALEVLTYVGAAARDERVGLKRVRTVIRKALETAS